MKPTSMSLGSRLLLLALFLCSCATVCNAQGTVSRKTQTKQTTQKETPKKQPSKPRQDVKVVEPKPQPVAAPEIPPFSEATGFANGHGYVDLGLPSGVKWAVTNIGAANPSQQGDFFAYADADIKDSYEKYNCKVHSALISDGIHSFDNKLAQSYDPATVNWGLAWNLPSKSDWEELIDKCQWSWATYQGTKGYEVTGPNGNRVFIQAAGIKNGKVNSQRGEEGYYLSSDFGDYRSSLPIKDSVLIISFNEKLRTPALKSMAPYHGYSVRPVLKADISKIPAEELATVWSDDSYEENTRRTREVSEPDGYINGHGYVDLGLPSGLKWAYSNVIPTKDAYNPGGAYPWGQTEPYHSKKTKDKYKNKDIKKLKSMQIVDNHGNLCLDYDAAHVEMGGSWRMPTKDEFAELIENCEWTTFKLSGWSGFKVIGPNGHSIFLPVTSLGSRSGKASWDPSYYWTSTAYDRPVMPEWQDAIINLSQYVVMQYSVKIDESTDRKEGMAIRAVSK